MIGGLQGEFGDLDIKYLKQKISKCQSQISGSFRRNSVVVCKMAAKFSQQKDNIFTTKGWFHSCAKFSFILEWSASNGCNSFISTPNRVPFEAMDCWLPELWKKYSMHKLDSRKCSKSGIHDCHLECFMADFSLLPLLAFRICLWQRTSKLRFFMFLSFPLLCHGFQITLLNLGLLWWSKSYQNTKTQKLNTILLELIARVLNMPIELKGNNYYSKVFKRVNYKLWNNTFWAVITQPRAVHNI